MAAVVLITTLTGVYTWQLLEERNRARLQAEKASRISEMLTTVLTSADPYRDPGAAEPTVRNLLDGFRGEGAVIRGPSGFSDRDKQAFANQLDRRLARRPATLPTPSSPPQSQPPAAPPQAAPSAPCEAQSPGGDAPANDSTDAGS